MSDPSPTAVARTGRVHRGGRWWRLAPFETRLLLRRRTTLLGLLCGPALMVLFGVLAAPGTAEDWGTLAGSACLVGMLVSVYVTAATVFTLRRESGALARLRTTELTGPGIVAAAGVPLLVAGTGQAVLVCVVYIVVGAPVPVNPALLVAALLLGAVFCVAAGALTATAGSSVEGVQFTATPLLLAAAVAANLLPVGGTPGAVVLAVPGVPVADLVARAWAGSGPAPDVAGVPAGVLGSVLLLVWTAVAVLAAAARWRWTPRG